MNVFLEFIKNKIKYYKFKSIYENYCLYKLKYDESSGFQLIDNFDVKEYESYLVISEDVLPNLKQKIDFEEIQNSDFETHSIESEKSIYKNICSENENLTHRNSYNFNIPAFLHAQENTCGSSNKSETNDIKTFDSNVRESSVSKYGIFQKSMQNDLNLTDYEESSENIDNSCVTPKIQNFKDNRTYRDEKIYFTPDNYNIEFEDKICINKDFDKSDILLLLRLKRKKLAILENQLRKDMKSLDISHSIEEKKVFNKGDSNDNFINCPAQLYFIKRRIDNTKEIIENTEKDIAILEEKTSETY